MFKCSFLQYTNAVCNLKQSWETNFSWIQSRAGFPSTTQGSFFKQSTSCSLISSHDLPMITIAVMKIPLVYLFVHKNPPQTICFQKSRSRGWWECPSQDTSRTWRCGTCRLQLSAFKLVRSNTCVFYITEYAYHCICLYRECIPKFPSPLSYKEYLCYCYSTVVCSLKYSSWLIRKFCRFLGTDYAYTPVRLTSS